MVARVTLAEIDVVRMSVAAAVRLYEDSVLPALREQTGYEGGYVLSTSEGKALVITFWESDEHAEAGLTSGFYGAQVQKFATVYRAQPGRELYDVSLADPPAARSLAGPEAGSAGAASTAGAASAAGAAFAGREPSTGAQATDAAGPAFAGREPAAEALQATDAAGPAFAGREPSTGAQATDAGDAGMQSG